MGLLDLRTRSLASLVNLRVTLRPRRLLLIPIMRGQRLRIILGPRRLRIMPGRMLHQIMHDQTLQATPGQTHGQTLPRVTPPQQSRPRPMLGLKLQTTPDPRRPRTMLDLMHPRIMPDPTMRRLPPRLLRPTTPRQSAHPRLHPTPTRLRPMLPKRPLLQATDPTLRMATLLDSRRHAQDPTSLVWLPTSNGRLVLNDPTPNDQMALWSDQTHHWNGQTARLNDRMHLWNARTDSASTFTGPTVLVQTGQGRSPPRRLPPLPLFCLRQPNPLLPNSPLNKSSVVRLTTRVVR